MLYKHKSNAHTDSSPTKFVSMDCSTMEKKRSPTLNDCQKPSKLSKIKTDSLLQCDASYEFSKQKSDTTQTDMKKKSKYVVDDQMNSKCIINNFEPDQFQLHKKELNDIMENVYKTQIIQKMKKDVTTLEQKHKIKLAEICKKHNKSMKEMEIKYKKNKRKLSQQVSESDGFNEDQKIVSKLTKSINTLASMKKIQEIQRLMGKGDLNKVLTKYFTTFKNILLGLTHGVIPLCQSQRDQVTNSQRKLVQKLQFSTKQAAMKTLSGKHSEIIKLFKIVNNSIHLVHNSYNKYDSAQVFDSI